MKFHRQYHPTIPPDDNSPPRRELNMDNCRNLGQNLARNLFHAVCGRAATALLLAVTMASPGLSATPTGLSFVVLGDWGKGTDNQRAVATTLGEAAAATQARFVISAGDNFYPRGVTSVDDPKWRDTFEEVYNSPALEVPWYPVFGNHDYRGNTDAQIEYSQASSRWQFPAPFYKHSESIDAQHTAEFFYLDTTAMVRALRWPEWLRLFEIEQLAWLEQALASSTATWKIVIGHHPVVSGGSHGNNPALGKKLQPLFQRYGVAAYICGHDHVLQHVTVDGVNYFVVGAGAETKEVRAIDDTQMARARLGIMTAKLTPDVMEASFIDATGKIIYRTTIARPR